MKRRKFILSSTTVASLLPFLKILGNEANHSYKYQPAGSGSATPAFQNKDRFTKLVRTFFFVLYLILFQHGLAFSTSLRLPAIIGSNMVLQQQTSCRLWGWSKAGGSVIIKVGWSKETKRCVAGSDGKWWAEIKTPAAGGPYEIIIKSDTTIILKNVLIGEVWICSGQSNMQMPFQGYISMPVNSSNDYIAHGHNEKIRLFTLERKFSTSPLEDSEGDWQMSDPLNVAQFSAVAYSFGKYIQEVLNVPVGLINSSWGDTPAEAWIGRDELDSNFKEFDLLVLNSDKVTSKTPSVLFNSMIHPILNFSIRGALWYQGTSNRDRPLQYARLLPALINNWRENWNIGEFPFYFVQIAPYSYRFDKNTQSAFLREAQLKTMLSTSNTGMVVTMDIGDSLSNHPPEKIIVGKRLAYWALAKTYGMKGISYSGPVYKTMTLQGNKAILQFDFAEFGLTSFGKELKGFVVAGEDKVFHPARAEIKASTVEVWSTKVDKPVSVRYCWANYAQGTLFNTAGLPSSSFRSDNWDK